MIFRSISQSLVGRKKHLTRGLDVCLVLHHIPHLPD